MLPSQDGSRELIARGAERTMIVTDSPGGRVLVQAQGSIALFVEPRSTAHGLRRHLLRNAPAIAALAAAGTIALTICAVMHERAVAQERQALFEERLMAQIRTLDERLQSALAGQESRLASRSDRLAEHVDVVGGRIVEEVDNVSGQVDLLPQALDKSIEGRTDALIGWLSAIGSKRSAAAPLTVHPADLRWHRRKNAN